MNLFHTTILSSVLLLTFTACTAEKSVKAVEPTQDTLSAELLTEGKEIHTSSCTKCHSSSVYTKEDRKVKTLDALTKRVAKCNINTTAGLDEEELTALTHFLNTSYYKFKK